MNGAITDAEIEKAAEERRNDEKENDPITLKILDGLRAGKNCEEIAEDVNLGSTAVVKRRKKLMEERKDNSGRYRCRHTSKRAKRKRKKDIKN